MLARAKSHSRDLVGWRGSDALVFTNTGARGLEVRCGPIRPEVGLDASREPIRVLLLKGYGADCCGYVAFRPVDVDTFMAFSGVDVSCSIYFAQVLVSRKASRALSFA